MNSYFKMFIELFAPLQHLFKEHLMHGPFDVNLNIYGCCSILYNTM